jgi:hypothetical protein
MQRSPHQTSGTDQHKRLVVGWFSFTCCEDSTILFTELLNDHLDEWRRMVEFRNMKALKANNSLAGLDVAFIEGAISSESQAEEVMRIRDNAWYVVAIGVVPLLLTYDVLVIAFGVGVWRSAGGGRALRVVGGLLVAYGVVGLAGPFAPIHLREALAAGEGTLTDTMHGIITMVLVLFMLLAIGFGAAAFGKRFGLYSIATILLLVVGGVLTGLDQPRLTANLPTPWMGVWERINIGVFLLWVVALAIALLRARAERPRDGLGGKRDLPIGSGLPADKKALR